VLLLRESIANGIITDKDLRSKIATGMFAINIADEIMSAPVITVPANRSVAEVQLLMMQHNIGHLCDFRWCANIRNIGIISEHDVLPLRLITLGACETNKTCKYCCRTSGLNC
jgi:CBS domain-containing protein